MSESFEIFEKAENQKNSRYCAGRNKSRSDVYIHAFCREGRSCNIVISLTKKARRCLGRPEYIVPGIDGNRLYILPSTSVKGYKLCKQQSGSTWHTKITMPMKYITLKVDSDFLYDSERDEFYVYFNK